jgi:hypothetical protein
MIYFCRQQERRALVLQHPSLNGIDYVEVCDTGADCGCGRKLLVTLLKDARRVVLTPAQIKVTGGAAVVNAAGVVAPTADAPRTITILLDSPGDFSTYAFALVATPATSDPPDGFDPQLSSIEISFKAGCDSAGDCAPIACCPPKAAPAPDINYLAKDFEGFTGTMLDRLAVHVPGWRERHPSDIGIALVEALAYVADRLSYQQDAVGTEAYLGTARSRISMRRHARLVDYQLDEGANARAWLFFEALQDGVVVPPHTPVYPLVSGLPAVLQPGSKATRQLDTALTFETMAKATLYQRHKEISFYTWSDSNCCLPAGSTQATLKGAWPNLRAGDALLFEERVGPLTGDADDADPSKRWVVRVTRIQATDYLNRPLVDPLNATPITRIWWDPADAPPFPLCLSSTTDSDHGSKAVPDVTVARGNMAPADHGASRPWEDLGPVPAAATAPVAVTGCTCGSSSPIDPPRARYYPQLSAAPLTFAVDFDAAAPASSLLSRAGSPKPQLSVQDDRKVLWDVLPDLLSSLESERALTPEIERDGSVFLRFGDGVNGMAADSAAAFQARYRTGNGALGNVGRDTLAHVVTTVAGIHSVRNPLAAAGGRDPESMDHIRQTAPFAFRSQLRAVTEADYGIMAQNDPAIREARGTLRWTGSWYTAFVSVDAALGDTPPAALIASTRSRLDLLRMAGVDLEVEPAILTGVRIEMNICVGAGHFQADVRNALMRVFISGDQCSGRPGMLNAANFTFGQTIYTSPLIAAAQNVDGVSSATLTVLQRMADPSFDGAAQGFLIMQRLEIARCENDPNRLDRGIFVLHMDGGK